MSREYLFSTSSMNEGVITNEALKLYLNLKMRSPDSIDSYINRLVAKNKKSLEFLGIAMTPQISEYKSGRGLQYTTSRYIGAVPTLMPNGTQGGDICVYPNLGFPKNVAFEELGLIFNLLGDTIEIEFDKSDSLKNAMDLKPPMFFEAVKYIDLYELSIKENWRKFRVEKQVHSYAKASTDWRLYSSNYYNPNKRFQFVSNDSILTKDHKEWRQLKYVYELARTEIEAPSTPTKTKNKYRLKTQLIDNRVKDIKAEKPKEINIHTTDPKIIKDLKIQAKRFLDGFSEDCPGWRIDIAKVYEKFVQYTLEKVASKMGGIQKSNYEIRCSKDRPAWALSRLEPDSVISFKKKDSDEEYLIIADAKYKSNMYNMNTKSDYLKGSHRNDLHQVLSYCSFAPQKNKVAMVIYPSNEFISKEIVYKSPISGVSNKVLLIGIIFRADTINKMVDSLCEVIKKNI